MDPGREAMESARRASENAQRSMEDSRRASENAQRSMEDSRRASENARWAAERRRGGNSRQSEHGLFASILLFPFRLIALLLRVAIFMVAIGIIVFVVYLFVRGGSPF